MCIRDRKTSGTVTKPFSLKLFIKSLSMLRKLKSFKYKNSIKLFLFLCASLISAGAFPPSIVNASDSRIEMLTESNSMNPGDELLVGFKFTLNPGWHTYWENPGDAGEGASIKWNLPNDVNASLKSYGLDLKESQMIL